MPTLTSLTTPTYSDLFTLEGFKKYLANTSWLMAEKFIALSVTLVVGVYVVRYLGPRDYGLLSYATSIVGLLLPFVTLGLNDILVRELVKGQVKESELLGTAFVLRNLGALLLFMVLAIALPFMHHERGTNLLIFVIATGTFFQSFNVIESCFHARVMSKYVAMSQSAVLILSACLKLICIFLKLPIFYFALILSAETFFVAMALALFYTRTHASLAGWRFLYPRAKHLLKNSWPLIFSGLVITIYMRIDQVMIKQMLKLESVGQFAAAVKLSEFWYFVPSIVCGSLFPAVLNAKKAGSKLYYDRVQKLYDLMAWIAIPVAVVTEIVAKDLIFHLFGTQFSGAGNVLEIHIWAGVFVSLGVASSKWLLAENLQVYMILRTSLGAVVNILMNLYMIPKYGIQGAAISTLCAQAVASYLGYAVTRPTRIAFWMQTKALLLPFRLIMKLR
jgi:O-antigen/teichoic acid export membrane protein